MLGALAIVLGLGERATAQTTQQASGQTQTVSARCGSAGRVEVLQSENFVVRSMSRAAPAQDVAQLCETLRITLHRRWLGDAPADRWSPRCHVIVHGSDASYLAAVGRGGAATSGSACIELAGDRVASCRIDLRAYRQKHATSALAHELTHVILADQLGGQQLPRWLDEGMATLADSPEKQRLHRRDFNQATETRQLLPLGELLTCDALRPEQMAAFYGQSLELVEFLLGRDTPAKLTQFARASLQTGYDDALRQVYAIDGVGELDRLWRRRLAGADAKPALTKLASTSQLASLDQGE